MRPASCRRRLLLPRERRLGEQGRGRRVEDLGAVGQTLDCFRRWQHPHQSHQRPHLPVNHQRRTHPQIQRIPRLTTLCSLAQPRPGEATAIRHSDQLPILIALGGQECTSSRSSAPFAPTTTSALIASIMGGRRYASAGRRATTADVPSPTSTSGGLSPGTPRLEHMFVFVKVWGARNVKLGGQPHVGRGSRQARTTA